MTLFKTLFNAVLVLLLASGTLQAATSTEFNPFTRKIDKVGSSSGGGDNVTVNGAAVTDADLDSVTPAAAAGGVNVVFQKDSSSPANVSAYIPEASLTLSNLGGSVTDGQVPNNITIDLATLATTATTANAGDNATAFFSAGTIEHERGGLEADVNAYDGLVGITGGATYNVTGTTTQIPIFDGAGAPTVAALSGDATMTNAGVVTVANDSHTHGTSTVSGLDISDDTNLAVTAPIILTGDTLSVSTNSDTTAGVVSSGSGQDSKVWKTDASGVPGWRADADSGGSTAWNAIGDAAADGSVDFVATEQDIVGQLDSAGKSMLTVTNQDADAAASTANITIAHNDGADGEVVYLDMIGDADGTPTHDYLFTQTGATYLLDLTVPTEAYDGTGWNGDNTVPTKDAVRDKIEALSGGTHTACITSNTSFAQTSYIAFGGGDSNTTLANRDFAKLDRAITITSITACVDTASGAGASWTASLNEAGSTTTASVVLSNVICNTAAVSEAVATSSLIAWEFVETGSAASTGGTSICYSYTT